MPSDARILLIDDEPAHLKLYGLIVEQAGYDTAALLIGNKIVNFPVGPIDLVILDYRLGGGVKAPEIAGLAKTMYPKAPIIVLSDMQWMPSDIAAFANGFVRKGEPEQLLEAIAAALTRN
jgi:CheY-like chemotaxis protein